MKNSSKILALLIILFATVVIFSILPVTASVLITPQTDTTTQEDVLIEAKYKKASTNKITFNGNGGKIGSKAIVTTKYQ